VAAAERTISAAGHIIVSMAGFPAADRPAADLCAERVQGCDVYVGVLGTRYGSPVRGRPEMSYTELEFGTATQAGMDRLVFMLDMDAEGVAIPLSEIIDLEFGSRQDAFRRRIQESGLVTRSFSSPAELGQLVERSLRELVGTRRRISSGIQREGASRKPEPSKFVNPPPAVAPTWFQGRKAETQLLARYVADPGIRVVSVVGRGGIGKTAMVCRFLKGLESGRIPDTEGGSAAVSAGGIVYLSHNGEHKVEYQSLVTGLLRLLTAQEARSLRRRYQDPGHSPAEMMLALLEAFPAGKPVIVLLDGFDAVVDGQRETLAEHALHEALVTVLTAPAHAVTVIATTRVMPTGLLKVESARQRQLPIEEGLGSPDAETVLRRLDDDGRLGLRDAPRELLNGLRLLTRGFPRALEAVKAILDGDSTLTPQDLLDRPGRLPEDQVIQVLVGEAYDLLDAPAKQVTQALAVYPEPVSEVGVDFLLRPVNPTTDAAHILARLVRRRLARFQDRYYSLHPIDRDYARSRIPPGRKGDSPAAFTLTGLQARAADFYSQIRTPPESWRTLQDVRPQLAEFRLRCDAGDYDTAATVLHDIEGEYLRTWGHIRILIDLHRRIHQRITDRVLASHHLCDMGLCHYRLGEYRQAVDLLAQAVAIARDTGDRQLERTALGNLGNCHNCLGYYQKAIDLQTSALAIARAVGNPRAEGAALECLGSCRSNQGEYRQAIDLLTQAITIACGIGDRQLEGIGLGATGKCYYCLGDYLKSTDLHTNALHIAREVGNRQIEGEEFGYLGLCRLAFGDYQQAMDLLGQALEIAREVGDRYDEANELNYLGRTQLALGDARQAVILLEQAVKIADSTGDIEPAVEARSALAQAKLLLGEPAAALAVATVKHEPPYPTEEPALRLLEGLALLELRRVDEAVRPFSAAVIAADELLVLADGSVIALQARALALSGLAVATGDPARAADAAQAFTRAHAVTRATGVVADTRRLYETIASHDQAGILADVRARLDGPSDVP
jgi:tetratricopeptide (TPR) repeat protein